MDDESPIEPDAIEIHAMSLDRAREARRWIAVLTPLLAACDRPEAHDRGDEVRTACETTVVAVLARVRRLVRSDLGAPDLPG